MDTEDAVATPLSAVSVTIRMRGHTLVQDKPSTSGGQDKGPMASELLLAGLLACQNSTFVKVAAKRKVEASILSLRGEMDFVNGDIAALRVAYVLRADAAVADKDLETCLRLTDKTCTISRALKLPVAATFTRA